MAAAGITLSGGALSASTKGTFLQNDDIAYLGSNEAAMTMQIAKQVRNYPVHLLQLRSFLAKFTDPSVPKGHFGHRKYLNQLQDVADRKSNVIKVSLNDLHEWVKITQNGDTSASPENGTDGTSLAEKVDPMLPATVQANSTRYIRLLYEAVEMVRSEYGIESPEQVSEQPLSAGVTAAVDNRPVAYERGVGKLHVMQAAGLPVYLYVPYEVRLTVGQKTMEGHVPKPLSVRDVRAAHVGALVQMDAIVTKVSSVKPRLQVAYYRCLDCGADVHQPVEGPSFMPLTHCESQSCSVNQKKGEIRLIIPESKFSKYQEVSVQEPSNRVPPGSIPRTQKIVVEGSLTRQLLPGMSVTLCGILTPVAKPMHTGYHGLQSGLLTEMTFLVQDIVAHKQALIADQERAMGNSATLPPVFTRRWENDPELYEKLAASIAPSIHGLMDVKKVLLLQLVGGVTETFSDGMRLRGDIHVLLMGDPGVAKSQLLGQVCRIAHRAHYTTGKGSSGVGLTASVVRDSLTGDFTLEGGAIVLSDKGICCIDEFDKMDEYDRTAIHEVMEQQTVSISKAGLTTTLNARTSILAAANPQYGRYDIRRSPMQNINLPAALLSRFDVQFLLLDRADREVDISLARHVLQVHQQAAARSVPSGASGTAGFGSDNFNGTDILDAETIRWLVAKAKTYNPKVPEALIREIVEYYVDLRQRERNERLRNEFNSYTTPRTLFAVLRLSQALARLRFSSVVDRGDFEEALRLVGESKRSVMSLGDDAASHGRRARGSDYQSDIMEMLKESDRRQSMLGEGGASAWLSYDELEEKVTRNGYSAAQLMETLQTYTELDVLQWLDHSHSHIAFTQRLADCV